MTPLQVGLIVDGRIPPAWQRPSAEHDARRVDTAAAARARRDEPRRTLLEVWRAMDVDGQAWLETTWLFLSAA